MLVMDLSDLQEFSIEHLPIRLELAKQSVHIWQTRLDWSPTHLHQFTQTLSPDEQARANRFRFERDRHWFIAGRGILRLLLSRYLDISPGQLRFTYSSHGKPALANLESQSNLSLNLSFNLSHSQGLALYGITCDRQIGIDIEHIRAIQDMEQLAQRFFLPSESALIHACPSEQQQHLFFHLWTCKEAYLKATGEGITGLKRVEIALKPGGSIAIPQVNTIPQENNSPDNNPAVAWTLMQLTIDPAYAAAIAVEGKNLQFTRYSLLPERS